MRLSNKFLAEHGVIVPKLSHSRCFTIIDFSVNVGDEQEFSVLMSVEAKSRNRLAAPGNDFRCAVCKVIPRVDQLMEKKQLHPSH